MFFTCLIIAIVVMVGLVGLNRRRPVRPSSSWADTRHNPARGMGVALLAVTTGASLFLAMGTANAAHEPTILLGDAAAFSVLAGTAVTNTGATGLAGWVGVSPGSSIDGGITTPHQATTPESASAQLALVTAYDNARNRTNVTTVGAELGGLTLTHGVYAATLGKAPLGLTGDLTLDGGGDPNSVFIFQTEETLITGISRVLLTNGAQACNVFWQVGSSATLGTGSTFVGNILALTQIEVHTGVTVEGRALARNAAVTLDTNTFTAVGCDLSGGTTPPTAPASTTTTTTTFDSVPDSTATTLGPLEATATTEAGGASAGTTPASTGTSLPFTGQNSIEMVVVAVVLLALGVGVLRIGRPGRRVGPSSD